MAAYGGESRRGRGGVATGAHPGAVSVLRRVGGDQSVQIKRRRRRRGRRGWIEGDGSGALRLDLVHADDVDEVGWRLDLRGRRGLLAPGEEETRR